MNELLLNLNDGLLDAELSLDKICVLSKDLSYFFDFRDEKNKERIGKVMYNYYDAAVKNDILVEYLAGLKNTIENLRSIARILHEKERDGVMGAP